MVREGLYHHQLIQDKRRKGNGDRQMRKNRNVSAPSHDKMTYILARMEEAVRPAEEKREAPKKAEKKK